MLPVVNNEYTMEAAPAVDDSDASLTSSIRAQDSPPCQQPDEDHSNSPLAGNTAAPVDSATSHLQNKTKHVISSVQRIPKGSFQVAHRPQPHSYSVPTTTANVVQRPATSTPLTSRVEPTQSSTSTSTKEGISHEQKATSAGIPNSDTCTQSHIEPPLTTQRLPPSPQSQRSTPTPVLAEGNSPASPPQHHQSSELLTSSPTEETSTQQQHDITILTSSEVHESVMKTLETLETIVLPTEETSPPDISSPPRLIPPTTTQTQPLSSASPQRPERTSTTSMMQQKRPPPGERRATSIPATGTSKLFIPDVHLPIPVTYRRHIRETLVPTKPHGVSDHRVTSKVNPSPNGKQGHSSRHSIKSGHTPQFKPSCKCRPSIDYTYMSVWTGVQGLSHRKYSDLDSVISMSSCRSRSSSPYKLKRPPPSDMPLAAITRRDRTLTHDRIFGNCVSDDDVIK